MVKPMHACGSDCPGEWRWLSDLAVTNSLNLHPVRNLDPILMETRGIDIGVIRVT